MTDKYRFTTHNSAADIAELWNTISGRAGKAIADGAPCILYTFYQKQEWNAFLERHSNKPGRRTDYILQTTPDGTPVAILPLLVSPRKRRLEILNGKTAGVLNAAVAPDADADAAMQALVAYLPKAYPGYRIKFKDIPTNSALARALGTAGYNLIPRDSFHVPLSDFESGDAYYASLAKSLRRNIKTRSNHLTADNLTMEVRDYGGGTPVPMRVLRQCWRLFFRRKYEWKGAKAISPISSLVAAVRAEAEARFGVKSASARELPEARVRTCEIGGRLAAFMLMYADGNRILLPKFAFDSRYRRYSPGIIMATDTLRQMTDAGVTDFDFCRGDEPYKKDVGGVCQPLISVVEPLH